ncbi:MAG: Nitrogen assimilation transcription factor nit-4 [Vezdaea aestivalis]|nr:MAG: Nitrogen assimilation transcription factor nit-4 [Vezdaea aestivalis]
MAMKLDQQVDIPGGRSTDGNPPAAAAKRGSKPKPRPKDTNNDRAPTQSKRRCVSTACIACRKRKSKCDGNTPSCAACASVYGTECIYDPNSDHRRKGVYKKDIDNLKTRNSTLQTLIQAILNYPDDEVADLVRQIRTCESLDDVAERILAEEDAQKEDDDAEDSPLYESDIPLNVPTFETQLSGRMGELRLEDGSVRFIGGTSNLIYLGSGPDGEDGSSLGWQIPGASDADQQHEHPLLSWTEATNDTDLIIHLITMYFTWHYPYFTTMSRSLFYRDFLLGAPPPNARRKTRYCSALLVNAILALGCHFTSKPGAREDPEDSATAGDHFFKEAKRLIMINDEHEKPQLTTVQALALMSVREAGCGRDAKGWLYSGMSFRMAYDMGLNLDGGGLGNSRDTALDEQEIDARRITIWGCFLIDKCWSNYLGRQPQVQLNTITAPKFDVFPSEDSDMWMPVTDAGTGGDHIQPSRTRAIALQISALCEISSDLLSFFYHPTHLERNPGKQAELKKLGELHTRLEAWKKNLPKELEPREGALPNVLLMHMFLNLLYIHLFRPFLRYTSSTSPLPTHVSPRKFCTQSAGSISKLLRLYKRTYGLRHICNVAVYICHSACTIHLLNLPNKTARRDIIHGVKHLEEIAVAWLCARRALGIVNILAHRWKVDLPPEAREVLARTHNLYGPYIQGESAHRKGSTASTHTDSSAANSPPLQQQHQQPLQQSPAQRAHQAQIAAHMAQQQQQKQAAAAAAAAAVASGYFPSYPTTSASSLQFPYALDALSQQSYYSSNALPSQPYSVSPSNSTVTTTSTVASAPQPSGLTGGSKRKTRPAGHGQSHASPTDLLGPMDVSHEDSHDWCLQEQVGLAVGFGNWNGFQDGETANGTTDSKEGESGELDDETEWYGIERGMYA